MFRYNICQDFSKPKKSFIIWVIHPRSHINSILLLHLKVIQITVYENYLAQISSNLIQILDHYPIIICGMLSVQPMSYSFFRFEIVNDSISLLFRMDCEDDDFEILTHFSNKSLRVWSNINLLDLVFVSIQMY